MKKTTAVFSKVLDQYSLLGTICSGDIEKYLMYFLEDEYVETMGAKRNHGSRAVAKSIHTI